MKSSFALMALATVWWVDISVSATEVFQQIPVDQTEALRMLADGVLDSATWRLLEPYYAEPLSVPEGELAFVAEVVPGVLPADLPSDPGELRPYEPWSPGDVRRFLSDYPHVKRFLPLISFTHKGEHTWGRLGFRLRRYGRSSQTQYANLRFHPAPQLDVRGRMSYSQESIEWQRRSVRGSIPHIGRLELGNYAGGFDDRLFLGYFPASRDTPAPVSEAVLYGRYSSWNGLRWFKRIDKGPAIQAFYHQRSTESAAGLRTSYRFGGGWLINAGASALAVPPADSGHSDTLYAAHGGLAADRGAWDLSGKVCVASADVYSIPFSLHGSHKGERSRVSLDISHVPPEFPAVRSRVAYELARRSAADTSQAPGTLVELRLAGDIAPHLTEVVTFSYAFSRAFADAGARFAFHLSRPLNLRLSYSYHPVRYPDRGVSRYHRLNAHLAHAFSPSWQGQLSCRVYVRPREYQSIRLRLAPRWADGGAVELQPYGYYSWTSASGGELSFGILQEFRLSPKTYGRLSLEIPWGKLSKETVAFNVSTQFVF